MKDVAQIVCFTLTIILAGLLLIKGEDIRSDIYTAAALVMMFIHYRGK